MKIKNGSKISFSLFNVFLSTEYPYVPQLDKIKHNYCFKGGNWHCLHIDELQHPAQPTPPVTVLQTSSLARLFNASLSDQKLEEMWTHTEPLRERRGNTRLTSGGGDADQTQVKKKLKIVLY